MEKMQKNIDTLEKHLQEYKEKCRKKTEGKSVYENSVIINSIYQICNISSYTAVVIYLCFLENQLNLADQKQLQQKVAILESNLKTNTENMEKKEPGKV